MAFNDKSLDDYVDVAQRLADFRDLYPEGSLQPADPSKPWEQAVVNGFTKGGEPFAATMIVYVAAAYRTPGDGRVRNAHSDPEHVRLNQAPPEDYGRGQRTRGPIPADADRWAQIVSPAAAPSPPARTATPVPAAGEAHHPGPAPTGHPAGREPATGPGPARASTGQAGIIHTHFGRLGFGDDEREQRLAATAVIAGVESVASTKDLDEVQARRVMDTLSRCRDRDALIALLAAGDKPGSDG